ncbi:MAG: glycerophosphoryl diester phosphodiesterase membrane domain-containing protein [Thermoplasmatota archaeon]
MYECPNCGAIYSKPDKGGRCPNCGYQAHQPSESESSEKHQAEQKEPGYQYYKRDISISDTFSKSFDILLKNIGPILVYWLIPILIVIVISVVNYHSVTTNLSNISQSTDPTVILDKIMSVIFIVIPLALISTIVQVLFAGGLVGMAKEAYETGKTNIYTGFSVISKYPLGIIGASILLSIVVGLGLFLCLIPGLLFCYWWLFTIPILIIEGKSITQAMSSSKQYAKSNETLVFTIVLIVVIVVLSLVASGLGNIISMALQSKILSVNAAVIFGPIIQGIISIIVNSIAVIAITVHYLKGRPMAAKEYEYQSDSYKPPAPPKP